MSLCLVNIHGDIEGDYEIIEEYNELTAYACAIKHECEKHDNCLDCPIFGRYRTDLLHEPTCPFFNADNPTEWLVN